MRGNTKERREMLLNLPALHKLPRYPIPSPNLTGMRGSNNGGRRPQENTAKKLFSVLDTREISHSDCGTNYDPEVTP